MFSSLLAGFVTLLTSVLVLKGPDVGDIDGPLRYVVALLLAGGAALAVAGLWAALSAESPVLAVVDFNKVTSKHGSVALYEQHVAMAGAQALSRARALVFAALAALIVGSATWWLVPSAEAAKPALVTVTTTTTIVCGEALDSPVGQLVVRVNGLSTPTSVPLNTVTAIAIVDSCSATSAVTP